MVAKCQYREYDPYWRQPSKMCNGCNIFKGLTEFHKCTGAFLGVKQQCKRCVNEKFRKLWKEGWGRKRSRNIKAKRKIHRVEMAAKQRKYWQVYKLKNAERIKEKREAYRVSGQRSKWYRKWCHSFRGRILMMMTLLKREYGFQIGYDEFRLWLAEQGFRKMFEAWQASEYQSRQAPTLLLKLKAKRLAKNPTELSDFKLVSRSKQASRIVKDIWTRKRK